MREIFDPVPFTPGRTSLQSVDDSLPGVGVEEVYLLAVENDLDVLAGGDDLLGAAARVKP